MGAYHVRDIPTLPTVYLLLHRRSSWFAGPGLDQATVGARGLGTVLRVVRGGSWQPIEPSAGSRGSPESVRITARGVETAKGSLQLRIASF
ncbi:hypothetical protein IWW55_003636 [Coemansia sp. RSA 2706]|nr:hypothetical protein IWW55_003636 [Coemansia sp. RSA 2706]